MRSNGYRVRTTRWVGSHQLIAAAVLLALGVGALTPGHATSPLGRARVAAPATWHSSDSLILRAREAMAQGRPWRATEILMPVVRDSASRTPEAVLLAARAANEWGGHSEVEKLLAGETWLDTLYDGDGRELLALARLAMGSDSAAVVESRIALATAVDDAARGRRYVIHGRALASIRDAAAAADAFDSAAAQLPLVRDWLVLRAAEWMADSAARRSKLSGLALTHVVARASSIDAIASENTGDTLGAITRYISRGDLAAAFRLRRLFSKTAADSGALRADILAALAGSPSATQARLYVEVFDSAFAPASPEEHLRIARVLGAAGGPRTARAMAHVSAAGFASDNDRFLLGGIYFRLGQYQEAIAEFGKVRNPPALAAAAAYQRARTMLRTAPIEETREALRLVVREHSSDTSAATALYLLADLATDDGRDDAARDAFLTAATRYPGSPRAPAARFHAAVIAYVSDKADSAAAEFRVLRQMYPRSAEATAALYWEGRALERAGDNNAFASACGRIRTTDSLSYYAARCAARSGAAFWNPAAAQDSFAALPTVDSAAARVRLLRQLRLEPEVVLELDHIRALAGNDPEQMLSAANTLRELGYGSRAIQLAQAAQSRGATPDGRVYRLLYPDPFMEMVSVEAAQYGLDINLLAGLIRQESLFNPAATSPAGARGLMQVMPAVGGDLARSFGFQLWDPVLLWQPDVNARLGVKHFADLVNSQAHIFHVLAAYNAGSNRVDRWLTKHGASDPEVFVERIPFVETRDYVRIVARNSQMYGALYPR